MYILRKQHALRDREFGRRGEPKKRQNALQPATQSTIQPGRQAAIKPISKRTSNQPFSFLLAFLAVVRFRRLDFDTRHSILGFPPPVLYLCLRNSLFGMSLGVHRKG